MSALWCRACGRPLDRAEALAVTDRLSGATFTICRYALRPKCFAFAGPASRTAIAMVDAAAVLRWDAAEASR